MPASLAQPARRVRSRGPRSSAIKVHAAKTSLARLLGRVERGERITIVRAGKPVAVISPVPAALRSPVRPDDPLLNLSKFGFDGPGGKLTNAEIDRLVYGV